MSQKDSFTRLIDIIPKTLNHFGVSAPVQGAQVINRWPGAIKKIVGITDPDIARAEYVKDGILTVRTKSSSVTQSLQMEKKGLIEELNKDFDAPRVSDIRFLTQ